VRFSTEVTPEQVNDGISFLMSAIGARAWEKRFRELKEMRNGSPSFDDYERRFALELAFERVLRYRRSTGRVPRRPRDRAEERLHSFVPIFARVHERLSWSPKLPRC
jgi:hypothetical protein